MSNLMNMRKAYKEDFEKKHGIKLGFMSCFVKASADALREMPAVNGCKFFFFFFSHLFGWCGQYCCYHTCVLLVLQ